MLKYQQNWGNDSRQEREEREDPQVTYQQGSMAYEKMYLTPLNSASRLLRRANSTARDTLHSSRNTPAPSQIGHCRYLLWGDAPALRRLAEGRRDHLCLFMQNKPNLLKRQMNVSQDYTKDYENKSDWTLGENKPKQSQYKANSKPKQTQSNPIQSQNKPNQTQFEAKTNPKQTQFKPNQTQFKANSKPIQSQFEANTNPIRSEAEIPAGRWRRPSLFNSKLLLSSVYFYPLYAVR